MEEELYMAPIPEVFYSTKTNKPFSNCTKCNKELISYNDDILYIIEKAFKQNIKQKTKDLIFEYAMCVDCIEEMHKEMSKKSLKRIEMYFKLYVDFDKREKDLIEDCFDDVEPWISNCVITDTHISELEEYQIAAFCTNDDIIFTHLPFLLGEYALEEIQNLLSKKTKGFIDGFEKQLRPIELEGSTYKRKLIFI